MSVIFPAKSDVIAIYRQKPMIRDRHPMGIAGQVLKHMLRPAKGSLRVNDPLLAKESAQESRKRLLVCQGLQRPRESQLFAVKGPP
jgi:hypothetical protein